MTDNLDPHGRPLGGQLERDGRLLAANAGLDLTAGDVDNSTREYWHGRARGAYEQLHKFGRDADGEESSSFHRDEAIHYRARAERLLGFMRDLATLAHKSEIESIPPQPPIGTRFVHHRTRLTEWLRSEDGWWRCGPQPRNYPEPRRHGGDGPCRNCPVEWAEVVELLAGREPKYVRRVLPGEQPEQPVDEVRATDGTPLLLRCGRCREPVGPLGAAPPFCAACVDRCHEATEFDHTCPVCQHAAVVAKQAEEAGRG